jgi:hypothetical protein
MVKIKTVHILYLFLLTGGGRSEALSFAAKMDSEKLY